MDLNELVEVFDDDDKEIIACIANIADFTVRERPDHLNYSTEEFFKRFRFKKDTIRDVLLQIEDYLRHDNEA